MSRRLGKYVTTDDHPNHISSEEAHQLYRCVRLMIAPGAFKAALLMLQLPVVDAASPQEDKA
jgi:hypothetical protein